MHDEAKILSLGIIPGINLTHRASSAGIASWLTRDVSSISQNGNKIIFHPYDYGEMLEWQAFDITRLTRAANESRLQSSVKPNELAWNAIKIYYSGFFSAAVIGRMIGSYITFMSDEERKAINARIDANGLKGNLNSLCEISVSSGKIEISNSSGKNSHEATWRQLKLGILDVLAKNSGSTFVNQNPSTVSNLHSLANNIHSSAIPHLSEIRNKINYRQAFNSWSPTNKYILRDWGTNFHTSSSPTLNLTEKNEIKKLFGHCKCIHELMLGLVDWTALRKVPGSSKPLMEQLKIEWNKWLSLK